MESFDYIKQAHKEYKKLVKQYEDIDNHIINMWEQQFFKLKKGDTFYLRLRNNFTDIDEMVTLDRNMNPIYSISNNPNNHINISLPLILTNGEFYNLLFFSDKGEFHYIDYKNPYLKFEIRKEK